MAKKFKKKISDKTRIRRLQNLLRVEKLSIEALVRQRESYRLSFNAADTHRRELELNLPVLAARIVFFEDRIKTAVGMTHEDRTKHLIETLNPPVVGEATSE